VLEAAAVEAVTGVSCRADAVDDAAAASNADVLAAAEESSGAVVFAAVPNEVEIVTVPISKNLLQKNKDEKDYKILIFHAILEEF